MTFCELDLPIQLGVFSPKMTTDTIGCRGFRTDVAPSYMTRNPQSSTLIPRDSLRVRGVLNILDFWVGSMRTHIRCLPIHDHARSHFVLTP